MSFMADQSVRLLKPGLRTVKQALQELYAIFNSDEPIVITSPVKLGPTNDDIPPLTITTNPKTDGTNVDPIVLRTGGSIVTNIPPSPGTEPFSPPTPSGGGGNSFLGVVASQAGGATYTCTLQGTTGSPFSASVVMQNIDPTSVLPSGVSVNVVKIGSSYAGFPSVFLPFS